VVAVALGHVEVAVGVDIVVEVAWIVGSVDFVTERFPGQDYISFSS
jgi:hypothetical protein